MYTTEKKIAWTFIIAVDFHNHELAMRMCHINGHETRL